MKYSFLDLIKEVLEDEKIKNILLTKKLLKEK